MIVTKMAVVAGVVVLGLLCWLAAAGVTVLVPLLVTGAALVIMVGGGNWLGGRTSSAGPVGRSGPVGPSGPIGPSSTAGIDEQAGGEAR
jgi:hypothetical protein